MSLFSLKGFKIKKAQKKFLYFCYCIYMRTFSQHYLMVFLENNNVTKIFVSFHFVVVVMYCFYFPFPDENRKTMKIYIFIEGRRGEEREEKCTINKIQMGCWVYKKKIYSSKRDYKNDVAADYAKRFRTNNFNSFFMLLPRSIP